MADVRYSVYNAKDDVPIIINGTSVQCAKLLGLTIGTFYSQASRQRTGNGTGGKRKYIIVREEDDHGEE